MASATLELEPLVILLSGKRREGLKAPFGPALQGFSMPRLRRYVQTWESGGVKASRSSVTFAVAAAAACSNSRPSPLASPPKPPTLARNSVLDGAAKSAAP